MRQNRSTGLTCGDGRRKRLHMYIQNITLYFTHLLTSTPSKDLHLNPFADVMNCDNFSQLVEGLGFCKGPNFAIVH